MKQVNDRLAVQEPIQEGCLCMTIGWRLRCIGLLSALAVTLSGCMSVADQKPEASTVKSGRRTELGTISAITPGCREILSIYPDTIDYPKHGQVSFEWKDVLVGPIKDGPRRACSGKRGGVAFVYYRSDPGFIGEDRMTLRLGSKITRISINVVK